MGNARLALILLLVAATLPLLVDVNMAAATTDEKRPDATLIKAFDPKVRYDKIPDDVLLDRKDSEWTSQKLDDHKFESKQNAIKSYVTSEIEKNGWNEAMRKTALITHNFDVMSGKAGNGFELVALTKALNKAHGTYTATEPEKRFHDWIATMYVIPNKTRDIDVRIDEIKDELGPDLVTQTVAAFDEQARHGNVPRDLVDNDTPFWLITAGIALCDHNPDCNSDYLKKIRDEKIYEREVPDGIPVTRTSYTIMNFFLPAAYATWVETIHNTYLYVRTPDCNYGNCIRTTDETTTGTYEISLTPPKIRTSSGGTEYGHSTGTVVPRIQAMSCTATNPDAYNTLQVRFAIAITEWSDHDGRFGCAFATVDSLRVHVSPRAS